MTHDYVGASTLRRETAWATQADYEAYTAALEAVEHQADIEGDAGTMYAAINAQHEARRAFYGA